jgi:hypothetical protein
VLAAHPKIASDAPRLPVRPSAKNAADKNLLLVENGKDSPQRAC